MDMRRSVLVLVLFSSLVSAAETHPTNEFYIYSMLYPGFIFFLLAWYGGQVRDGGKVTYYGFDPLGRVIFFFLSGILLGVSSIAMISVRFARAGSVAYVFATVQATGIETAFCMALGLFSIIILVIGYLRAGELAVTPLVEFVSEQAKGDLSRKRGLEERRLGRDGP
jgi:hypothetical protein